MLYRYFNSFMLNRNFSWRLLNKLIGLMLHWNLYCLMLNSFFLFNFFCFIWNKLMKRDLFSSWFYCTFGFISVHLSFFRWQLDNRLFNWDLYRFLWNNNSLFLWNWDRCHFSLWLYNNGLLSNWFFLLLAQILMILSHIFIFKGLWIGFLWENWLMSRFLFKRLL